MVAHVLTGRQSTGYSVAVSGENQLPPFDWYCFGISTKAKELIVNRSEPRPSDTVQLSARVPVAGEASLPKTLPPGFYVVKADVLDRLMHERLSS